MVSVIVNIDVPDLRAARAFYESGLGFAFSRMLFGGAVAELTAGGTKLYLIEQEQGSTAVAGTGIARDYASHWTPVHLDVLVEDIEAALASALGAGATQTGDIKVYEWGKLATLRDPFGHGVCLLQFLGGGYDLVEG
ncbi:MAG: VOC family protein [Minwuiales bacterium]|nr:VOC family protein [Minwuiales bacterium]